MLTYEFRFSLINSIYWLCTLYVLVKILLILWTFTNNYIVTIFKKPIDFKSYGKWAVITGSTDGVGKEFAKELARRGVDICLISRNEEKLKNIAKEIGESSGVETMYIVADFTDANIYDHIKGKISGLDIGILVNNVGIIADDMEEFSDHNEQLVKDYINVNVMALTRMTHLVLPCMLAKKSGLILNMSSLCGEILFPYVSQYCATKAYITMFGSCLSYELKIHNIQVTTFTPGMISTSFFHKLTYVAEVTKTLFPPAIVPVEKFVRNALRSVRSGSYLTCGYFLYDIIFAGSHLFPDGTLSRLGLIRKNKN